MFTRGYDLPLKDTESLKWVIPKNAPVSCNYIFLGVENHFENHKHGLNPFSRDHRSGQVTASGAGCSGEMHSRSIQGLVLWPCRSASDVEILVIFLHFYWIYIGFILDDYGFIWIYMGLMVI
jgi:hypothetical protein